MKEQENKAEQTATVSKEQFFKLVQELTQQRTYNDELDDELARTRGERDKAIADLKCEKEHSAALAHNVAATENKLDRANSERDRAYEALGNEQQHTRELIEERKKLQERISAQCDEIDEAIDRAQRVEKKLREAEERGKQSGALAVADFLIERNLISEDDALRQKAVELVGVREYLRRKTVILSRDNFQDYTFSPADYELLATELAKN